MPLAFDGTKVRLSAGQSTDSMPKSDHPNTFTNHQQQVFVLVAIILHAAAFFAWGFLFLREQRGPKEKAKAH